MADANMTMTEAHKRQLRACRVTLVGDMEPEDVLDHFANEFTGNEMEDIKAETTRHGRVKQFLDKLERRPDRAYGLLLNALDDTNQEHLATELRKGQVPEPEYKSPATSHRSREDAPGFQPSAPPGEAGDAVPEPQISQSCTEKSSCAPEPSAPPPRREAWNPPEETTNNMQKLSLDENCNAAECTVENIAKGIGWEHFFGYHFIVLERFRKNFETTCNCSKESKWWNLSGEFTPYKRMLIIVPSSGYQHASLAKYDPAIRNVEHRTRTSATGKPELIRIESHRNMAGHPQKDYSCPMLQTTVRGKTYLFVAEVPNILKGLLTMIKSDYIPSVTESDHAFLLRSFITQLCQIISISIPGDHGDHKAALAAQLRRDNVSLIYFDDTSGVPLSEVIAQHIEASLALPPDSPAPWLTESLSQVVDPIILEQCKNDKVVVKPSDLENIAVGTAWRHFFGWLYLCLSGLSTRIEQTYRQTKDDWDISGEYTVFPRMIVILPFRGYEKKALEMYDNNIRPLQSKVTDGGKHPPIKAFYRKDMPGFPDRDYSSALYHTEVAGKKYVFVAEVPTCLNTLKTIERTRYVPEFSGEHYIREKDTFCAELERIFRVNSTDRYAEARRNALAIIRCDDSTDPHQFSKRIAAEIDRASCDTDEVDY